MWEWRLYCSSDLDTLTPAPLIHGWATCNLAMIGQALFEKKRFVKWLYIHVDKPGTGTDNPKMLTSTNIKVKCMKRSGTEAIRTQLQSSKPKREIINITNSQNTKRTYDQPSEQLFPKRWPLSNRNRTKNNMKTRKVKRHRNSDTKIGNREPQQNYRLGTTRIELLGGLN